MVVSKTKKEVATMAELIDEFDEFTVGLKFQKEWGLGVALSHFLEGTGAGLFMPLVLTGFRARVGHLRLSAAS